MDTRNSQVYSVHIGHLHNSATKKDLYDAFKHCGQISSTFVADFRASDPFIYGFVRFTDVEGALNAVREMDQWVLKGQMVTVSLSGETRERMKTEGYLCKKESKLNSTGPSPEMMKKTRMSMDHLISESRFRDCCTEINIRQGIGGHKLNAERMLSDMSRMAREKTPVLHGDLVGVECGNISSIKKTMIKSEQRGKIPPNSTTQFFEVLQEILENVMAVAKEDDIITPKVNKEEPDEVVTASQTLGNHGNETENPANHESIVVNLASAIKKTSHGVLKGTTQVSLENSDSYCVATADNGREAVLYDTDGDTGINCQPRSDLVDSQADRQFVHVFDSIEWDSVGPEVLNSDELTEVSDVDDCLQCISPDHADSSSSSDSETERYRRFSELTALFNKVSVSDACLTTDNLESDLSLSDTSLPQSSDKIVFSESDNDSYVVSEPHPWTLHDRDAISRDTHSEHELSPSAADLSHESDRIGCPESDSDLSTVDIQLPLSQHSLHSVCDSVASVHSLHSGKRHIENSVQRHTGDSVKLHIQDILIGCTVDSVERRTEDLKSHTEDSIKPHTVNPVDHCPVDSVNNYVSESVKKEAVCENLTSYPVDSVSESVKKEAVCENLTSYLKQILHIPSDKETSTQELSNHSTLKHAFNHIPPCHNVPSNLNVADTSLCTSSPESVLTVICQVSPGNDTPSETSSRAGRGRSSVGRGLSSLLSKLKSEESKPGLRSVSLDHSSSDSEVKVGHIVSTYPVCSPSVHCEDLSNSNRFQDSFNLDQGSQIRKEHVVRHRNMRPKARDKNTAASDCDKHPSKTLLGLSPLKVSGTVAPNSQKFKPVQLNLLEEYSPHKFQFNRERKSSSPPTDFGFDNMAADSGVESDGFHNSRSGEIGERKSQMGSDTTKYRLSDVDEITERKSHVADEVTKCRHRGVNERGDAGEDEKMQWFLKTVMGRGRGSKSMTDPNQ